MTSDLAIGLFAPLLLVCLVVLILAAAGKLPLGRRGRK